MAQFSIAEQMPDWRARLRAALSALTNTHCRSVMLWTLAGNPVRRWDASLGGRLTGEQRADIDGREVVEVAYGWPEIGVLLREVS